MSERIQEDFKKYLEIINKPKVTTTTTSGYNYTSGGYKFSFVLPKHEDLVKNNDGIDDITENTETPKNWNDKINLFFYEMSDTKSCIHFNSMEAFDKFVKDNKLNLHFSNRTSINCGCMYWACCVPNSADIFLRRRRKSIVNTLEEINNGKKDIRLTLPNYYDEYN